MDTWTAAIFGLILAALPLAVVALVSVVGIMGIAIIAALFWLLQQHPRVWLLALCIAFDAIVLIPVWLAAWLISSNDPALWNEARLPVHIFSAVLLVPTVLLFMYCMNKSSEID
jgi:hypothetical protein